MDHDRDDSRERRGTKLSPAGRELLSELERSAEASEPPSEETLARAAALPRSDREEIAAIFGATAQDFAERQRENVRGAALEILGR